MLAEILSKISDKNSRISSKNFVKSYEFWDNFFKTHIKESEDKLALSLEKNFYEFNSLWPNDEYDFAKKIMSYTALNYLFVEYPSQITRKNNKNVLKSEIEPLARKTLRAFAKSKISYEAKNNLNDVAQAFGLRKSEKYKEIM